MYQSDNSDKKLEDVLDRCRRAARNGYSDAYQNLRENAECIDVVSKSLSQYLRSFDNETVHTPEILKQLKSQLCSVVTELKELQAESVSKLKKSRERLDKFSITVFGRTMAGKSTLMEILTHGNGESIGNGAQRTTRDVRTYQWKGLEVTDVPGVAAFEGAKDEELAFESASQADMVLFLITDDAPQSSEAECLAKVRSMGKPVLGICNVKAAVDSELDLRLFFRDSQKKFDQTRISELREQFYAFTNERIPFVVTHLRARFLADMHGYEQHRDKLLKESRFDDVESFIVKEIVNGGVFFREKTFIDGSVVPMMDLTDRLLVFSSQNSDSGRVLVDKRNKFRDWKDKFCIDAQKRINTVISRTMESLRNEVPCFAENHYQDESAGEKWNKLVKSLNVNHKMEMLQKELLDECNNNIGEIFRELKYELKFVADRYIKMEKIFDTKRLWNWGITIIGGGISVAAIVLGSGALVVPGIVVAIGGWLISLFFDSREVKSRRAREKLSNQLYEHIKKMECDLQEKLRSWFQQEIVNKRIDVFLSDLYTVTSAMFTLADNQRTLACTLNNRQKKLGRTLVKQALRQLNAADLSDLIKDVARVPGKAIMFLINPGVIFPEAIRRALEMLLKERIWFVIDTKNTVSILSQAIGRKCKTNEISLEKKISVARVSFDNIDENTKIRIKLAQQLTGFHIMR